MNKSKHTFFWILYCVLAVVSVGWATYLSVWYILLCRGPVYLISIATIMLLMIAFAVVRMKKKKRWASIVLFSLLALLLMLTFLYTYWMVMAILRGKGGIL